MINYFILRFNQSSQAISVVLGTLIMVLLIYVLITNNEPTFVFNWLMSVLGDTFIVILLFLTITSLICIINVYSVETSKKKLWFESGLQLSNLISTIALTYTLLGISLGIGELSASKLDVNTINQTISKLTEQFSMAFMTSVIGLPLSAILRSIIVIFYEQSKKETNLTIQKLIK